MKQLSVLHVEDSSDDAELIARELSKAFTISHRVVSNGPELLDALKDSWDIVLSDFSMPGFSGLEALELIRQRAPDLPFVFVSGTIGEERAVAAIKSGATDFVVKDSLKRLIPVVERVLKEAEFQKSFKEAKVNLQKSQALYKLLAENSSDIIAIMGEDNLVKYVSPAIESISGYKPEELLETTGTDLMHPQDARVFQSTLSEALKSEAPFQVSYRVRRKDGEEIWLEALGKIIRDSELPEKGVLTVTRDITARRRADARVREQATLLDIASDSIIVRDLEHRVQYWNKGSERVYGWTAAEIIGKSIRDLIYETPQFFDEAWATLMLQGEFDGELQHKTRAGNKIISHARWTLLYDDNGNPKSVLCINSDITERKKLEQQFLRAQRMESIGTLAGGIAHDLNNMLTPILLAIEVLKMGQLTADQDDLIATIDMSARRGADMVKQVLSFARGVESNPQVIRAEGLVAEIGKIIRDTFPKNIELQLQLPAELWQIKADSTQFHQVLLNLAVNARDAMPAGGKLTISACNQTLDAQSVVMRRDIQPGKYVEICVEDTGTGMPADVLEKIFEPFYTTKEIGRGTGLGLSTTLGIVKSHGGFLYAYSEPGKGTKFQIYLPKVAGGDDSPQQEAPANAWPRGKGELILLVDDEKAILDITRQTLEAFGYRVKTASDGLEAIVAFTQFKDVIHLVLTDMMMPGLDGLGAIQVIRRLAPAVPIIAASGLGASGKNAQLEEEGVKLFLSKPFSTENLLKTVNRALTEGKA